MMPLCQSCASPGEPSSVCTPRCFAWSKAPALNMSALGVPTPTWMVSPSRISGARLSAIACASSSTSARPNACRTIFGGSMWYMLSASAIWSGLAMSSNSSSSARFSSGACVLTRSRTASAFTGWMTPSMNAANSLTCTHTSPCAGVMFGSIIPMVVGQRFVYDFACPHVHAELHVAGVVRLAAGCDLHVRKARLFAARVKRLHTQHERVRQVGSDLGVVCRPQRFADEQLELPLAVSGRG